MNNGDLSFDITPTVAQIEDVIGSGDAGVSLTGNARANDLAGGAGDDSLSGAGGDDTLQGDAGNDTLLAVEAGNDTLAGGTDDDVYLFNTNSALGSDTVTELAAGGTDGLDFSGSTGAIQVDLGIAGFSQAVNGNLNLTLTNAEVENIVGGSGNDDLTGNAGDNTLDGGVGDDTVLQTADSDQTLTDISLTGAGNDTLSSIEDASLTGGASDNTLDASAFTGDVILWAKAATTAWWAASGSTTTTGGDGNDTLTTSSGTDSLDGGAGDDTLDPDRHPRSR